MKLDNTVKISEIKLEYKETDINDMESFIKKHIDDSRKGVINILNSARKQIEKYNSEIVRVENMLMYENSLEVICAGIDEAGRGPLAGPVVAGCVILNPDDPILYVDDSKKLSAKKREELYDEIVKRAIAYKVGVVSEKVIDDINILNATYKAMEEAIKQMKVTPEHLLIDAVKLKNVNIPQTGIIKGDSLSLSIAAASILAKVTRDRIMIMYDELYPEYDFKHNKGYGSQKHIEALKKYGPCPIHRASFIKNFI